MPSAPVAPAPAPPPPAYPQPVTLPPAPDGDPAALRASADAFERLASAVEAAARQTASVLDELAISWSGAGAATRSVPADVIARDAATTARGLRDAAGHLREYAAKVEHAHQHHGLSLGRLAALGAIVIVGTAAVTVTLGAAAPIGTAAAIEAAEAIEGVEAASAAAGVAAAAAAETLEGLDVVFLGLRTLASVLGRSLLAGAQNAAFDAATQLVTTHDISLDELVRAGIVGAAGAGVGSAALGAVQRTDTWVEGGALARAVTETAAEAGGALASEALDELSTDGRLDSEQLLKGALYGSGSRLGRVIRWRVPDGNELIKVKDGVERPQRLSRIVKGFLDLRLHENINGNNGHTLRKHVGRTVEQLRQRIAAEGNQMVSSFRNRRTAERAITEVIRAHEDTIRAWMSDCREGQSLQVHLDVGHSVGTVVKKSGEVMDGSDVIVVLGRLKKGFYIHTAYLAPGQAARGGA